MYRKKDMYVGSKVVEYTEDDSHDVIETQLLLLANYLNMYKIQGEKWAGEWPSVHF